VERALHDLLDGRDDVRIAAAATDIAAHQFANVVTGPCVALGNQPDRRADLTRRAIAALKAVMRDERLLQRMQSAIGRQAFDGRDLGAVFHNCKCQAGHDTAPIDEHRAGRTGHGRSPSWFRLDRDIHAARRAAWSRAEAPETARHH
jgi:hypothetical protein